MPKTLFGKIWDAHEVADGLIYIDLHLVHEVTSPQAFESCGSRALGAPPGQDDRHRRPQRAHRRHTRRAADPRRAFTGQVETLERNCEEFGVPIYSLGSDRQGIVHVIGPELGLTHLVLTVVCGDSHTRPTARSARWHCRSGRPRSSTCWLPSA